MSRPAAASLSARVGTASMFLATILGTIVMIGVMLSFDLLLAKIDRRESARHAAAEYTAGVALLQAGRARDAAMRFGAAVAIDRLNVNYARALGEAQLADGRWSEAEATIKALLDRAENDGAVNLTMAHVLERGNHLEEATAYYHRAIFGHWGADSSVRRRQARLELIDLLAKRRAGRELLAELLPLEETPADSVAVLMRTLAAIVGCTAPESLVDSTVALLGRSPRVNASERAADALASRATALWNATPARCDAAVGDEVLRLLQSRLAQ